MTVCLLRVPKEIFAELVKKFFNYDHLQSIICSQNKNEPKIQNADNNQTVKFLDKHIEGRANTENLA